MSERVRERARRQKVVTLSKIDPPGNKHNFSLLSHPFLVTVSQPAPLPPKTMLGRHVFCWSVHLFFFDPLPFQHCFRGRGGSTLFWGDGAGGVGGGRRIHKTEVMFVAGLTARNCPSKEEVRFRTRAPVLQLLSMNA